MQLSQTVMARELGISSERLKRQAAKAGFDLKPRQKLSIRDAFKIMAGGDLQAEKIRETAVRADLMELERREKEGETVTLSKVQEMLQQMMAPIRARLNAMPSELANRTNPTDPQLAKEAAEKWRDEAVKLIREEGSKAK